MKKLMFLITSFIFILAGCGNSDELTIGLWQVADSEMDIVDQVVADFEDETGIPVEVRLYTDYDTELNTELQGGNGPDAFYVGDSAAPQYIRDGALEPLSSYLTEDEMAAYYPNILTSFQDEDGEVYALPKDWSTLGLFCNEDLLKEAGTSCSEVPTDYKDMPEFIESTQKNMPEGSYVYVSNYSLERLYPFLLRSGENIMKNDTETQLSKPALVDAGTKYFEEFGSLDGVKFTTDLGYTWSEDAFMTQEAALVLEGSWFSGTINEDDSINYQVLQMPAIYGQEIVPVFATGWGVNSQSDNKENAVDFIKYATIQGSAMQSEKLGNLPANQTVADMIDAENLEIFDAYRNVVDDAVAGDFGYVGSALFQEWGSQLPLVINGDIDVETAFNNIDEKIKSDGEQFNG